MGERAGMNVLIVDDCQADTKLLQLWLRDCRAIGSLSLASAGRTALRYVRGEGEFQSRVRPELVLLDSNLPDMHGLDVLEELKRDPHLADIGFFVLSGTFHENDARRARELGAVEYRIKPFEADDFEAFVRRIEEYWASR
jgi:chemotaxis family two-component system response regulator Rcp1